MQHARRPSKADITSYVGKMVGCQGNMCNACAVGLVSYM